MQAIQEERESEENMGSLNSRKKSRSNNHSRVSSKNSKDLAKLKPADKKTLVFSTGHPTIQEVDQDENRSNGSARELSSHKATEGEKAGPAVSEKAKVEIKFDPKLRDKLFPKSISKICKKDIPLKKSIASVKTEKLSTSLKISSVEKGGQPVIQVQKLITRFKNGSHSFKREELEADQGADAAQKVAGSQFGTSSGQLNEHRPEHARVPKLSNHRRAISDTDSLTYTAINKGGISARNYHPLSRANPKPHNLNKTLNKETAAPGKVVEFDHLEIQSQQSGISHLSGLNKKKPHQPELKSDPMRKLYRPDFLKKQFPRTLMTESQAEEEKEQERQGIAEENQRLRAENQKQREVGSRDAADRVPAEEGRQVRGEVQDNGVDLLEPARAGSRAAEVRPGQQGNHRERLAHEDQLGHGLEPLGSLQGQLAEEGGPAAGRGLQVPPAQPDRETRPGEAGEEVEESEGQVISVPYYTTAYISMFARTILFLGRTRIFCASFLVSRA